MLNCFCLAGENTQMPAHFPINPAERLPYLHDQFVNRVDDWRFVVDKAERLAANVAQDRRVIIFHGARGAGKSWLLQEIKHQLGLNQSGIRAIYISLSDFVAIPVENAMQVILHDLDAEVACLTGMNSTPNADDLAGWASCFIDNVRRLDKVLVLLFDHVDESPDALLALLEDHCLSPLSVEPKVLIVLAGLGKHYIWKGPELRLKSEERTLARFNHVHTLEQLKKQSPASVAYAADIHAISDGYPWLNYLLRDIFVSRPATLRYAKDTLFGAQTRLIAQPHLEALCVLRAFDENRMSIMFAAYYRQPTASWSMADCRNIRGQLTQARLALWDKERQAFALDSAVKSVLENSFYEDDRPRWLELQCTAYCLYRKWAARYPRTAILWQTEAEYHAQRIADAGFAERLCDCTEEK